MELKIQDVKTKLREIQKNASEPELFPYLQQLFIRKGYSNVQITHGKDEYGKDLVFSEYDERRDLIRYTAVVVKNKDAGMKDFEAAGEIQRQIDLCFKFPYLDDSGKSHHISFVIVVINGSISANAKQILEKTLPPYFIVNIEDWNYQRLAQEFYNHIGATFLSHHNPQVNLFLKHQEQFFLAFNGSSELYQGYSVKDLNDIYVNVRTTLKRLNAEKKAYTEYEKGKRVRPEEDPDDSIAIINSNKSFIVHGIPTSGKSLLLRRIGYNSILQSRSKPVAPFFFELYNYQDVEKVDIWKEINDYYSKVTHGEAFSIKEYSRVCLLLDGIDEIPSVDIRLRLVERIAEFESWFKKNTADITLQIIFSTRDIGFIENNGLLADFEKVELLPFDVGQAFKLVQKLIPGNKVKAEGFIKAIKDSQLSNSLTRTPMALSLMAILYREEKIDLDELPANITELYNKFTDYYLNRWDTSKGLSLQYKYEESKHILALIAKDLHEKGRSVIDSESLIKFLHKVQQDFGYEELNDINKFLNTLRERSGIIHYDESSRTFTFTHLAFQEYFVSIAFDDSEEDEFCDNFFENWWANVIIFYCGKQPKRDVFLKKVLKTVKPLGVQQIFVFLNLVSKSFQASYLISNATKKALTVSLIYYFDQFYKQMIEFEQIQKTGMLYHFTTIDFIVELREFFKKLLSSKHFNKEQVAEILKEELNSKAEAFSDIALYSIAHFLSNYYQDVSFLQQFIELPNLDERWQRIIYIDMNKLKNKSNMDEKLFRKVKRNQLKYRTYIEKQFRQSAYKYLLPIMKD